MEFSNGKLRRTRSASHPSITLNATINSVVYNKLNVRAPKAAARAVQAKLTTICDTGAMMCVMGRSMLDALKMNKSELVKVTERLMAANGDQIALDGAVSLDLSHGDKKTMQMAYVSAQVKQMLLSQTACKGLGLVTKDFPKWHPATGGEVHGHRGRQRQRPWLQLPHQVGGAGPAKVPQERQLSGAGGHHQEALCQLGLQHM